MGASTVRPTGTVLAGPGRQFEVVDRRPDARFLGGDDAHDRFGRRGGGYLDSGACWSVWGCLSSGCRRVSGEEGDVGVVGGAGEAAEELDRVDALLGGGAEQRHDP